MVSNIEVSELLGAAFSVATGEDSKAWRDHGEKMLARHRGKPLEEIVAWGTEAVMEAHRMSLPALATVTTVEQLAMETMPFYFGVYQWAQAGFPHFSLTSDFFDAIATTDFGDPTDEPVNMPFHAFTLSFPKRSLFAEASRMFVYRLPVVRVVGGAVEVEWKLLRATLMVPGDPVFSQWGIGMSRAQLSDPALNLNTVPRGARPLDPGEEALMPRTRNLLVNTVSYIDCAGPLPTAVPARGASPAPVERAHKSRPLFDVGRTVRLDSRLREAMRASEGDKGKWKLAQRFVVRGHWRMQAHGPQRALRTRKWIEPFWKGPDNVAEALTRLYEVA